MYVFDGQKPIYLQLKAILEKAILDDVLKPDNVIPSVRAMAKDYQLNPMTIISAVDELVYSGILYTKRGIGIYVSANAKQKIMEQQLGSFKDSELILVIERAKSLGISKNDVEGIVNKVYGGKND